MNNNTKVVTIVYLEKITYVIKGSDSWGGEEDSETFFSEDEKTKKKKRRCKGWEVEKPSLSTTLKTSTLLFTNVGVQYKKIVKYIV